MIISRTPLRMSFVGGGSDMSVFYRKHQGAVVSSTIDKYVYLTINKKFSRGVRLAYSKNEEVKSAEQLAHPLVRASMKIVGIEGGVEITTVADIPSKGTGLGSSSAFTVGLLHVLYALQGKSVTTNQLALESCRVEIEECGAPIGKQDQYASAIGGFNLIEFNSDESVSVKPLSITKTVLDEIERNLLVMYTGISRSASTILAEQSGEVAHCHGKQETLKKMVDFAYDLKYELEAGNTDSFGEILHENWILKKSLANSISSREIDDWYSRAIKAGAKGGKILGAGAGGFLLFYAPPEKHRDIEYCLDGLRRVPVKFEKFGSQIVFSDEKSEGDLL